MKIRVKLIDSISEIEPLNLLDSISIGNPLFTKRLYITKPLDIIQLKLRWMLCAPDITSLTIIDNQYLICPIDKCEWLQLWRPILHADPQCKFADIDLSECPSFHRPTLFNHNVIILPDYNGDYSFHFGHFQVDVLPILKSLKESLPLKKFSNEIRYSLNPLLSFHKELLSHEGLFDVVLAESNMKIIDALAYADSKRIIWIEKTKSRLVIPDLNYGFAKAIISKVKQLPTSNLSVSAASCELLKTNYKGLIFDRLNLTAFPRLTNCSELLSKVYSVKTKANEIWLSFESLDYIKAGVIGRVEIAKDYDFVIGPFGSHFVPTMLDCRAFHMFIVPFRPPESLVKDRLEGFLYYPDNFYKWIVANPPSEYQGDYDMESFHYINYAMNVDYVITQIVEGLANRKGIKSMLNEKE